MGKPCFMCGSTETVEVTYGRYCMDCNGNYSSKEEADKFRDDPMYDPVARGDIEDWTELQDDGLEWIHDNWWRRNSRGALIEVLDTSGSNNNVRGPSSRLGQEIYLGWAIIHKSDGLYEIYERERTDKGWTLGRFRVSFADLNLAYEWIHEHNGK